MGEALDLTVKRGEQQLNVSVTPEAFTDREAAVVARERWGLAVRPGRPGQGLALTEVTPGSPAAKLGLRPGDVLIQIGGEKLADAANFTRAVYVNRMHRAILVMIERDGRGYYARMAVN